MTMRWLNLGMLLLGTVMFACGEDAPPIDPPPAAVAQTTTQSAAPAAKDAGTDAETEASAPQAEPPPAPPAGDDDDDHDRPSLGACLLRCGADLACGRGCFSE